MAPRAASARPAGGAPPDPAEGTVTALCTPVADTTTLTVRGTVGSTAMQLAGGDGDGVAVLTVDVEVDVVVVVVLHHTGEGLDTEMLAVPACAPSKLACMVPSAS